VLSVGAGIVHYRFWPAVRPTIDALYAQTRAADHLVVVENGSGDNSARSIKDAYPGVDVVEVSENRGPIGGMNLILDTLLQRNVDAILLLTHETLLAPDALESLIARLAEDERIGVVGPLLAYRSRPDELWSAGGVIDPNNWDTDHVVDPRSVSEWKGCPPRVVDWLEGACVLYRSEAVRAAGRLHEPFFMMFDEPDYQLRLKSLGWRAECVPAAVGWQEPGGKPPYIFTRNRLGFIARRAPKRVLLRELRRVCYDLVRDGLHPRPGCGGRSHVLLRARGLFDFIRNRWGRPPAAGHRPQVVRRSGHCTRVLIVVPSIVDGGVTFFNLDLASALRERGLIVTQFTIKTYDPAVLAKGYEDPPLTVGPGRFGNRRIGYPLMAARLLLAAARADVVLSGWEVGEGLVAAFAAGRLARKVVVGEMQADPIGSLTSILEYDWAPWTTIPAARWIYSRLDAVICVSEGLRERAPLIGVHPDSVRVIPNGVNLERVRKLAVEPGPDWLPEGEFVVGVGRLVKQKGYDILIEAHARVRKDGHPHKLVIAGEGPERQSLEALAAHLEVADSVVLPGFLTNPFSVVARASLFCLPSRYEGLPLVVAEALTLGVPVVAANCISGPGEILDGGRYGELVEVESIDALATAIGRHLRSPAELAAKARAAQTHARYSIADAAERYAQLFEELLTRRRA
jgi:glycosyltransferase involved in cell wall biosynthesis